MTRDLSRAQAILIGNGGFKHPRIHDLPARECVAVVADLLAGELCGWPAGRIVRLEDVAKPDQLAREVSQAVRTAQDVLLVYYVGHGFRTRSGKLALALGDTDADPELLPYTAMLYEHLADILRGCRAATKLVILDCCHAALGERANYVFQGDDADLADAYPVDGLYFIGASKWNEKAKTPEAGKLTYFTQYLVEVVRGGIPGQPAELRLDQIFLELRARLVKARLPEPVDSGIRGARQYPFAHNAAPPETLHDPDMQIRRLTQSLAEAHAREQALRAQVDDRTAELSRLREQARHMQSMAAGEQQQLRDAINVAERQLGETVNQLDKTAAEQAAVTTRRSDIAATSASAKTPPLPSATQPRPGPSRKSGPANPPTTREAAEDLASAGRLKQIRMVAGLVHKSNPRAMPIVIGSGLGVVVIFVVVGLLTGLAALLIPLGVLLGVLISTILFGRFAQAAQYSAIERQPGAAAAVLENMRGNWTVTPAVAANRNMDMVHRAVGRPGIILVGEGSPNGVASLLAAEKRRVARVAYDVPITEFQVGNGAGQIPLSKLQRKIMRLPRQLKPAAISDVNYRLKALQPSLQAPKGPIPKNIRQPRTPGSEAR